MTGSMRQAIDETSRRRAKQLAYTKPTHHAAKHHQAGGYAPAGIVEAITSPCP